MGTGKALVLLYQQINSGHRLTLTVYAFGNVWLDADLICSCCFCLERELDGSFMELNNVCLCPTG